jgi:hypothetical protein
MFCHIMLNMIMSYINLALSSLDSIDIFFEQGRGLENPEMLH